MRRRKIITCIAVSADGFIARPDGNFDWLNARTTPGADYGLAAFFASIDTILWGRKTYQQFASMKNAPSYGPAVRHYVFSHAPGKRAKRGFRFVSDPVKTFAQRIRAEAGKDIWMMGGGGLIASFLDAGEIDEFIISVVPVFIGKGLPLVQPKDREVGLKLVRTHRYPDGVVTLHYRVSQ